VAAQQLSLALTIALVNWHTTGGSLVLFYQAQTVYLLPWAVLAVPVATSAYPVLAGAFATGDAGRFRATLATATRSVLLLSGLGAAALVALAWPGAWLLAHLTRHSPSVPHLAAAIIGFAPGLLGYGLFALHSRALYARGQNRSAAVATVLGWGAVAVASVLFALLFPASVRVPAMTAANSVGMVVLGIVLLVLVRRRVGGGGLAGVRRAGGTAVLAGTLAALAGVAVRGLVPATPGFVAVALTGMLSGVVVGLVFGGIAVLTDRPDTRPMLARLLRLARAGGGARRGGAR
jgi:putative peptidoglycan lipid II flippase